MAKVDETPGIPGKRLLPQLGIGCLLFAAIMGFGTYFVGKWMAPAAKQRNDQYLKENRPKDMDEAPGTANVAPASSR